MALAGKASSDFDLAAALEALFRTRAAQFAWFLLFALATRFSVFGDTNYYNDEYFYFQAGIRMHDGALPYVDVWDRKGPGLFATYWLIAFFSKSVLAFQIAALLFAAATAHLANLIAERFAGRIGAMLSGTLYLVMIAWLGGGGGQTPVFYNLWMALAALGVVRAAPLLRQGAMPRNTYAAMAAAGLALTYKQTAICEAAFLGGYAVWQMCNSGAPLPRLAARATGMALAGAAPMLAFTAFFGAAGHMAEFWHAMVTANLRKSYVADDLPVRLRAFVTIFAPAWLPALAALAVKAGDGKQPVAFLAGWTLAALGGVVMIPNFYEHYLLPLCLPACILAARFLGWRTFGPAFCLFAVAFMAMAGPALNLNRRDASREAMARLEHDIRARDPHPRLFVYAGPVDLYRQFAVYPPSPLYYPTHLNFASEIDVSHLSTRAELLRILAWRPSVVLTYAGKPRLEQIPLSGPLVRNYIGRNCRLWFVRELPEAFVSHTVEVWGDCAQAR